MIARVADGLPLAASMQEDEQVIYAASVEWRLKFTYRKRQKKTPAPSLINTILVLFLKDFDPFWTSETFSKCDYFQFTNSTVIVRINMNIGLILLSGPLNFILQITGLRMRYRVQRVKGLG